MLIKLFTEKTVSDAAAALQASVQANHFGVILIARPLISSMVLAKRHRCALLSGPQS